MPIKHTEDGITYYHLRRVVGGHRYGYDLSFSEHLMRERRYVALTLRRAREHLTRLAHG